MIEGSTRLVFKILIIKIYHFYFELFLLIFNYFFHEFIRNNIYLAILENNKI